MNNGDMLDESLPSKMHFDDFGAFEEIEKLHMDGVE